MTLEDRPAWEAGDGDLRHVELVYVGTLAGGSGVVDLWEDPRRPVGALGRVFPIVTVRLIDLHSEATLIPWNGLYAVAWDGEIGTSPQARFLAALDQGRARAEAGAPTLD
ncbi:MAG TPA: hypothetical protein VM433_12545 [Mycobacteriales bacterium]|nr:hypothetical protein [Mycobacteriales bacterium]